jgi:hypothetical protein
MPIRSVWLGLNFEEAALENIEENYACETHAVELCIRNRPISQSSWQRPFSKSQV